MPIGLPVKVHGVLPSVTMGGFDLIQRWCQYVAIVDSSLARRRFTDASGYVRETAAPLLGSAATHKRM